MPIVEIFCLIDDFCKTFDEKTKGKYLPKPNRKRLRPCKMSLSEIMTIVVMFHLSHYRTFKDFYQHCLVIHYRKEFPSLVSYNRFIELMPFTFIPLFILQYSLFGKRTGKYFIDSTKLEVCHNLRIFSHKVFKNIAKRGKTSTGWFFGFKLHLIINNEGELVNFWLTTGNIDDRSVVSLLVKDLKGWLFGDKGYVNFKLFEALKKQGLELITRFRKNMKSKVFQPGQEFLLSKRGVIESVIDQLKSILQIQHTRHRSVLNFQVNILAGLIAYTFIPKKPSVGFHKLNNFNNYSSFLISN
ncbi:MAG: IS982 family transposase [Proteobacteria bacterium]|nr:IS982 family transposase [Pseudomonadota bacterium]